MTMTRQNQVQSVVDTEEGSQVRLTTPFPVMRYNRGGLESKDIELAREVPYTLFVNDREILSIATLPTGLKELFAGFLVSEGVLHDPEEILEFHVDHGNMLVRVELEVPRERLEKLETKGMLTSGCAGGLVFSTQTAAALPREKRDPLRVACSTILARMYELDTYRGIYSVTRGVHAASLADDSGTLLILEDLGRHNAVDKIAGHCFLNRVDTSDKLLLTTGRITSEVLTKAARSGFSLVISRSSASALAVAIAKQSGIDVVTYVRAKRFNYFSHGAFLLTEG